MESRRRRALAIGIAIATILVGGACSLTTNLNGFSNGDDKGDANPQPPDGSSTSSSGDGGPNTIISTFDAGPDATKIDPLPTGGVVLVKNVAVQWAGGAPQQHHAVFSKSLDAWLIFFLRAAALTQIDHKLTGDFTIFANGPSITLPFAHNKDGRGFDVAYAALNATDVFHVGISLNNGQDKRFHYHARKTSAANALFSTPVELTSNTANNFTSLDPDGTTLLVLETGKVLSATGFITIPATSHVGNFGVALSKAVDTGNAVWAPDIEPVAELEVANNSVNARALVKLPNGAFAVWERADSEPSPSELAWAKLDGTVWSNAAAIADFPKTKFNVADWGLAAVGGKPHVVRWANGEYLHRYYDNGWQVGPTIPFVGYVEGQGLVVLEVGGTLTVFALTPQTGIVRRTRLVGNGWTSWEDLTGADPTRSQLSGSAGNGVAVLLWTTTDADGLKDLVALRVP